MPERMFSEEISPASETQVTSSLRGKIKAVVDGLRVAAGGVPESAWSMEDRERMAKGKLPRGHPEHPNV